MNRMRNHSLLALGVRAVAIATLLGLASCGGDSGPPSGTGGSAAGGRGGTGGSVGGRGGTTGSAGTGGATAGAGGSVTGTGGTGTAGTTGTAGRGGTTGTAGSSGTTGTAGTGGSVGGTGGVGTAGTTGGGGTAGTGGTTGGMGGSVAGNGGAGTGGTAGAAGGGGTMDAGDDASDGGSDTPTGAGNGTSCTAATECASNACVDGVCCESACTDSCKACVNSKTTAADGLCRPVTNGTDPDNECAQQAPSTCGTDGMCDGAGACRVWATGITCVPESCTGATYTPARVCNGAGACQTVNNASCGAYVCGATSCKTTCASGADCASGNFCSGTSCMAVQGLGASCGGAGECASGFCVDGVCCESDCTGSCVACSNAKTTATNGLCRPVSIGTDPDNECPQDTPASCGFSGTCDGAGACGRYSGTICVTESCSGATYTPARTCNGSGVCQTVNTSSCGSYTCGATACRTSCASNADCTSGFFCLGSVCTTVQAQGAACTDPSQCSTGACVDGFCCETACTGGCMACAASKTAQANGLCRGIIGGTDPDNDCTADPSSTCGLDGTCDGNGACRKYTVGTICVAASCSVSTFTPSRTCDGAGTCGTSVNQSCGAYACGAATCGTSCVGNSDCSAGYHCVAAACVPVETNGTTCDETSDCASGYCVDGVCCDTSCVGTCQTCNATNSVGTCKFSDPGTNPRNECTASAASSCGTDGTCDGAGACRKWVAGTVCLAASCASAQLTAASTCNGTGTCNAGATTTCGAYQCAGSACATTCASDAGCNGGAFCAAATCYASPVNLAGNGDLEYGAITAWTVGGGTAALQNAGTSPATVHAGTYALGDTGRTANFQGPQYNLPTGAGVYNVTLWAMSDTATTAAVQINRSCGATAMTDFNGIVGSYGFSLPANTWTKVTGSIDLTNAYGSGQGTNCQPGNVATPGVVRQALMYLNQTAGTTVPNLYIDDLVVTATDGHNLVGNPNFEAGATTGWQNNGGGTLGVTTAIFHGGTQSLALTGRTATFQGPRWNLPLGAARYNITFNAFHDGAMNHDLILQPTYTCQGGSAQFPASIAVASQAGGNSWNTLSGTYTFPPVNATPGCKMTSAAVYLQQEFGNGSCSGVECPNLYVDDVSITLVP